VCGLDLSRRDSVYENLSKSSDIIIYPANHEATTLRNSNNLMKRDIIGDITKTSTPIVHGLRSSDVNLMKQEVNTQPASQLVKRCFSVSMFVIVYSYVRKIIVKVLSYAYLMLL